MVEINNSEDLRAWLKGKPREYSVVIASRIALRVLPLAGETRTSTKIERNLIKSTLRANLISWVACKYPAHNIKRAAKASANAANAVSRPASHNAPFGDYIAADAAYKAADAAYDYSTFANRAADTSYIADIDLLEQGMKPEQLAKQPLWQGKTPPSIDEEWQNLKKTLLAQNQNWQVWIDWYEDILAGRKPASLPDDIAERLYIKIATQENDFWEKDFTSINADITEWTDKAKKEADERKGQELTAKDYLALAIETASPAPFLNEDNQLDVTSKTKINEPIPDEELHLLPERARRQINNLLAAFKRKNISPILKSSLKNYLSELDRGFDFEITYLDDDIAIIRAERDADIDKIWCDAGVEVAINNLSEIHDKIQKHYPLDLEREEYIKQAPIDPAKFDGEEYRKNLEQLVNDTQIAFEEGKVTKEFLDAVERQERQYNDIATLYPVPVIKVAEKDRIIPVDFSKEIKKRHMFQVGGFWGGADKLHKVVGITAGIGKLIKMWFFGG